MNARPDSLGSAVEAELRSVLENAQAAVWDWQIAADRFDVDENWLRTLGVDAVGGNGALTITEWKRRIHPDDHGAFVAAAESCHHGGERFECEYRLLAAGHRWLWVLHRGRVTQRDRDGSALRLGGLLLDIDRRKGEEVARSDSESRLATALWGARAAFWQWHVPSNSRTASPLWLAMTGYSRAQWDGMPNPWYSNLHADERERVDRQLQEHAQGLRDSVEFEYRFLTASGEYRWVQDRGRAVEWDLQGRPVLVIGVTLDIDAAKRAEAHLQSADHMLETAAWGAGIGLWETNFITDTTRWFNDWCERHDIDPCDGGEHVGRWDENLHPDEGPEATRRFYEHVNGKADYYDAEYRIRTRAGQWRWVFERGRVVERDAQGKAVRMLGVCMDLDETKVAERRANARNERVEARSATDYRRRLGLGRRADTRPTTPMATIACSASIPHSVAPTCAGWRQMLGTDPEAEIEKFPRTSAPGRSERAGARNRISLPPHRWLPGTGRWTGPSSSTATRTAPRAACSDWWWTSRRERSARPALSAADQRFRAVARELRCVIYEIDAETGLSTGEGSERVIGYSPAELPRAARLGRARASGRSASAPAVVQPARGIHGRRCSTVSVTATDTGSRCSTRPALVRDASGKVVRIVGVAIDITSQAGAQEALRSVARDAADGGRGHRRLALSSSTPTVACSSSTAASARTAATRSSVSASMRSRRPGIARTASAQCACSTCSTPASRWIWSSAIQRRVMDPRVFDSRASARCLRPRASRARHQRHRDHRSSRGLATARDPGAHVRAAARRLWCVIDAQQQHPHGQLRPSNACSGSRPARPWIRPSIDLIAQPRPRMRERLDQHLLGSIRGSPGLHARRVQMSAARRVDLRRGLRRDAHTSRWC